MKKNILIVLLAIGLAYALGTRAQTTGPIISYVLGTSSSCTLTTGQTTFCFTTGSGSTAGGLYVSSLGGAFALVGGEAAAGVTSVEINGVTKSGAVAFTITANPPTITASDTASAPSITAQ